MFVIDNLVFCVYVYKVVRHKQLNIPVLSLDVLPILRAYS